MASWHNDGDGTGGGGGESYETYPNLAGFPATGETGVLYVAADTGKLYRWTGSAYVVVSDIPAHAASHADGGADEVAVAQSQVTGLTGDLAAKVSTTRTVNGHPLTGDVTVTKSDVGLGNVTDDAQLKAADLDTDAALTANSDGKVPSQKAVKAYADGGYRPGGTDVAVADGGTGASNKAGAQANLGIPVVPMTVVGDGGGNHTTTSSTFADVNAAYSIAMPAVVGDLLEIEFQVQLFHSGAGNQGRFKFTVAGTVISNMPTNGLYYSIPDANSHFFRCAWFYVVQSGDISGGTVTVKPQFATNTATLSVRNDGTNGKPLFIVRNWRQ